MSTDICLPRVSSDDAAVTLVKWHVTVGSSVVPGDVIAEIESDKAVVELEAELSGVITEILVPEGSDEVRAEQVLAVLDESPDAQPAPREPRASAAPGDVGEAGTATVREVPAAASPQATEKARGNGDRPGTSPLAARMARQAGVDLENITGSGPDGRILADDVRAALGPAPGVLSARQPQRVDGDTELHGGCEPEFDIQTPDNMRRVIAERLVKSKREAPHFYMSVDCCADALLDLKNALADNGARSVQVSLNDLILKITATTLKRVPALNAAWSDAGIRRFRSVDLAVAVAIEGGLITPVIREADKKRIPEIAVEMRGRAPANCPGRNIRAVPSPCRTWACTASAVSPPSSIRPRRPSSPSAPPVSGPSPRTAWSRPPP